MQLTATVLRLLLLGYSGVLFVALLKQVLNRKAEISSVITLCIAEKACFLPLLLYFYPCCLVAITKRESLIIKGPKIIRLYFFSNAHKFYLKNVCALKKRKKYLESRFTDKFR